MKPVTVMSCEVKDGFASRRGAMVAVRHQLVRADRAGKRRPTIQAFRCSHCSKWHIGNVDTRRPKAARAGVYQAAE